MYCERCGVKNNSSTQNCIGCGANLKIMVENNKIQSENLGDTQAFKDFSSDLEKELSDNNSFENTDTFNENFQNITENSKKIDKLNTSTDMNLDYLKKDEQKSISQNRNFYYEKETAYNSNFGNTKISSHMVLSVVSILISILLTCFCCGIFPLITSVLALVNSLNVNSNIKTGNLDNARKYSSRSKMFGIISLVLIFLILIFSIIISVICYLNPDVLNKVIEPYGWHFDVPERY